jgi:hypothetical protein
MSGRLGLTAVSAASLVVAGLYVVRAVAGQSGLFQNLLTDVVLLRAAAVCKLASLVLAFVHAEQTTRRLEPGNPARAAWRFLALAMAAFALAQLVLSSYQIATGVSPFPSVGDVFFLAAYPLLITSFGRFIRAYRETGFPVGSAGQHGAIAGVVALLCLLVAVPILRPVVAAPSTPVELFLNVAYPVLDFVLLVPLFILLRVAWPFRGGPIFRAWALLLGGVVSMCAGDLLFAWFSLLGATHLDPLTHGSYLVGYVCLAWGTRLHRDLVAG